MDHRPFVGSSPALRFPPQTAATSRVACSNARQAPDAQDAAIASESADAVSFVVEAKAFKKDQSAMALALRHPKPGLRVHASKSVQ
jgi:hypothetical protein